MKKFILIAGLSIIFVLALGIPTAVIPNTFFVRMTPVYWFDYIFLAVDSLLLGIYFTLAIAKRKALSGKFSEGKAAGGGVLGFLAVACPICNKLLLWLFGATWLLQYFEPIRPVVGILSVAILLWAIRSMQKSAYCAVKTEQ